MKTSNDFYEQSYTVLRQVPKGRVTTYKAIADALGSKAYRAVGRAMAQNPNLISTPCHRVVLSDGSVGNYMNRVEEKIRLLESEGLSIHNGKVVNFQERLWTYSK